jgi:hypothetical protein
VVRTVTLVLVVLACCSCSSLLPRSEDKTASNWTTYQEAQKAFDQIEPGKTTVLQLKGLSLDPSSNANIAILNYADVLRRFMVSQAISFNDLDAGVLECVTAKTQCRGFEVDQRLVKTHRKGNFWLDILGFHRETRVAGWRFNGLVLLKGDVVVYKLTGGQPAIDQLTDSNTPLGPVQSLAGKFLVWSPPGGGN